MLTYWLTAVATCCFAMSLFIETSSWSMRAHAKVQSQGLFNARCNIYLYSARMFYLIFMGFMAWTVDSGWSALHVQGVLAAAVSFALFLHSIYAYKRRLRAKWDCFLLRIFNLDTKPDTCSARECATFGMNVQRWTTIAATVLMCGVTLPFFVASLVPQYRMMIGTLAQSINALGTLVLLIRVDAYLYRSMDKEQLPDIVTYYIKGRLLALLVMTALFWLVFGLIYRTELLSS